MYQAHHDAKSRDQSTFSDKICKLIFLNYDLLASTVVEHTSHCPKVKGLRPASVADIGKKEKFTRYNFKIETDRDERRREGKE
jgi:hypothetical protein